ncbi:MAG: DMT family transporter [Proteobacteria bacterium]|nr:DMT family transporter [Pseudomonadota bacterium]
MKPADLTELVALAAVWGGSFLFMRMGAGEFGPFALVALRVGGAALLLMPWLVASGGWPDLKRHWRPIFVVGVTNSALPFLGFAYAAMSITAGLSAVFNAAAPLFGAAIGWLWLKDRLNAPRLAGLAIGFGGVLWLAGDKASFKPGGSGWAVVACLAASLLYGVSANLAKRYLAGVKPLAVAAGSQLSATLVLAIPAALAWPEVLPSQRAWTAALLLAFVCTGLAYVMFFRLIAHVGPSNAIAVTFLVPVFAIVWGSLMLGEVITPAMVTGCAVILTGTALATGLVKPRLQARA